MAIGSTCVAQVIVKNPRNLNREMNSKLRELRVAWICLQIYGVNNQDFRNQRDQGRIFFDVLRLLGDIEQVKRNFVPDARDRSTVKFMETFFREAGDAARALGDLIHQCDNIGCARFFECQLDGVERSDVAYYTNRELWLSRVYQKYPFIQTCWEETQYIVEQLVANLRDGSVSITDLVSRFSNDLSAIRN